MMFEHTRGDDFSKAGVFRNSKTRLPIDLSDIDVFAKVVFVDDEDADYRFNGSSWVIV